MPKNMPCVLQGMACAWAWACMASMACATLTTLERWLKTNLRGEAVDNWVQETGYGLSSISNVIRNDSNIRIPNGKLGGYTPIPIVISTRGYGVQLNTFYNANFDSKTNFDEMKVTVESG